MWSTPWHGWNSIFTVSEGVIVLFPRRRIFSLSDFGCLRGWLTHHGLGLESLGDGSSKFFRYAV
jgi:hypothetical protein